MNYAVGLIGVWVASDGIYSILYYLDDNHESWWRNHSVRILRVVLGISLVILGAV